MKKTMAILLSLCLCLALAACSSGGVSDDSSPDGGEYTLDAVAGWWTKPDDYDGITLLYTFCVDAGSGTVISYDDYGNVCDTYPCWYDDAGFTIDCGEFFGLVTFTLAGDTLLDGEGDIQYVRGQPLSPDAAPFSREELTGVWYKNGETDAGSERLVLEANGYQTLLYDTVSGDGSWSLSKVEAQYNDSYYTGPAVDFEGENGFPPSMVWVLEGGTILYDAFHEEFYIKEGLDHGTWETLCEMYALIRDSWECEEDGDCVRFLFFREVCLSSGASEAVIGRWEMGNGTVNLEFVDGSVQECIAADEIWIDYCGKAFVRREAW